MLPKIDGWEVCRRLRKGSEVPVIMLTARGEDVDKVSGLTLGANDYVAQSSLFIIQSRQSRTGITMHTGGT